MSGRAGAGGIDPKGSCSSPLRPVDLVRFKVVWGECERLAFPSVPGIFQFCLLFNPGNTSHIPIPWVSNDDKS